MPKRTFSAPRALDARQGHVDFDLLRTLHALLETRSTTRAAVLLGRSQPSVSRALARLRNQFDDALLIRGAGGLVPTPRAQELVEPLARWLSEGELLLRPRQFNPARLRRTFKVASTDFGTLAVIAPVLGTITGVAPDVEVIVDPLTERSGHELARGDLDLIVTGLDPDPAAVHSELLFVETFLSIARRDHPAFAEGDEIDLDTFLAWPHVMVTVAENAHDPLEGRFPPTRHRRTIMRSKTFMTAPFLAMQSDAFMTLPAHAARQFAATAGVRAFEPPLPLGNFNYWLAWHERSRRDPATLWLIDCLAEPFRVRQRDAA